jgi:hypothetical protein
VEAGGDGGDEAAVRACRRVRAVRDTAATDEIARGEAVGSEDGAAEGGCRRVRTAAA